MEMLRKHNIKHVGQCYVRGNKESFIMLGQLFFRFFPRLLLYVGMSTFRSASRNLFAIALPMAHHQSQWRLSLEAS